MKKNVKLVKYVLMCAISLGVTSTVFTSCKDYDDDINNLQQQVDANKTECAKQLAEKVTAVETQIAALETAKVALEKSVGDAKTAAGKAQETADQAVVDAANAKLAAEQAKLAAIETAATELAKVKTELLAADKKLQEQITKLDGDVAAQKDLLDELIAADQAANEKLVVIEGMIKAVDAKYDTLVLTLASKDELKQLEAKIAGQIAALNLQYSGLEEFNNLKDGSDKTIKDLETDIDSTKSELTKLKATLDQKIAEAVAKALEDSEGNTMQQLWESYTDKALENYVSKEQVASLVREMDRTTQYVAELSLRVDKISADLNTLKAILSGTITSLTYVPENISENLGEVAFLPEIALDYTDASPLYPNVTLPLSKQVYEYDVTGGSKSLYATVAQGWATMNYIVNPTSVSKDDFTILGFDNKAVNVTKANASIAFEQGEINSGVLPVKIKGLNLIRTGVKTDNVIYDNPEGPAASSGFDNVSKVDMVALQVTTKSAAIKEGTTVTSNYVPVKRMVVKQNDVIIALAKEESKHLKQMFKIADADAAAAAGGSLSQQNVQLNVLFKDGVTLDDKLNVYTKNFYTNNGFKQTGKYFELKDLGFDDFDLKYELVGYNKAEVDQTMTYIKTFDSETGKIVFDSEKQSSAIGREPIIKVKFYVGGTFVMSKLLKIKVIESEKGALPYQELLPLGNHILPCMTAQPIMLGGDMDKVFDATQVSKEKFWTAYDGEAPTVVLTRYDINGSNPTNVPLVENVINGVTYHQGLGVTIRGIIRSTAITDYNLVTTTITGAAPEGNYQLRVTYNASNVLAEYTSIPVGYDFNIKYPKTGLIANVSMWEGNNMLIYGKATADPYTAPYLMQGVLENGFNAYQGTSCPQAITTLHFELVDVATYAGVVAIEHVGNTHIIKLNKDAGNKWKKILAEGTKIKVRAFARLNEADLANPLEDKKNIIIDRTNSEVFEVVFKDPISATAVTNNKWYLIDKSLSNASYGRKLPVYRLFTVKETQKENNGVIWEPTQAPGWWVNTDGTAVGEGLRGLHALTISYKLNSTKNTANVISNVIINDAFTKEGVIEWNNSGDAVVDMVNGQKIYVDVVFTHSWGSTTETIVVTVYPAAKAAPSPLPSPGIIANGTTY